MAGALKVGDKAPDFSLKNENGKTIALKGLRGKPVVLYFYPKDDTPGCTKEACGFRDSMAALRKTGAVVLGVSLDDEAAHRKFIAKYDLPFSLLVDEDITLSKAYGVYVQKSMYGKKYWGIERSTFVIDPEGKLSAMFRKVKVDGHVEEVLTVLKSSEV
ncbi:MAG: thioredoxin-dependent thiol peroxidase [Nitrospira sp.]|nr:MAG: thioredoxin-dependent thiol peroxidase [Nitrospira sp.]